MLALDGRVRRGVHVVMTFAVMAAAAVAGTAAPATAAGQSVGPGPTAVSRCSPGATTACLAWATAAPKVLSSSRHRSST